MVVVTWSLLALKTTVAACDKAKAKCECVLEHRRTQVGCGQVRLAFQKRDGYMVTQQHIRFNEFQVLTISAEGKHF